MGTVTVKRNSQLLNDELIAGLENTYFNFATDNSDLQDNRKRTTLDKPLNYSEYGVMTRKEFIFHALIDGYKPIIKENYSYYSRRLDDYTKPKTRYTMENEEGSLWEITKTEHEYATFIIDNGYTSVEKALQFIKEEKAEKTRQERIQQEKELQKQREIEQRRAQEELERKERIKALEEKRIQLANEFIERLGYNPITKVLDGNLPAYFEIAKQHGELTEEMERQTYQARYNKLVLILGDIDYSIYQMKYYAERYQEDQTNFDSFYKIENIVLYLEQQLLFEVYSNVNLTDKPITITAKMKAIYEGREYKGSNNKSNNVIFYWYNNIEKEFQQKLGKQFKHEGYTLYIEDEKSNGEYYVVTESQTGSMIAKGETKKQAIKNAKESITNRSEQLEKGISRIIELIGQAPKAERI